MSAGLGTVPPARPTSTSRQGNRVFNSLYDEALPPRRRAATRPPAPTGSKRRVDRAAEAAPAEIDPNLLGDELQAHGVAVVRVGASACAFGGSDGTIGDPASDARLFAAPKLARRGARRGPRRRRQAAW